MKFIFIKTDKSEGWTYTESVAELAIKAENLGHKIKEIKDISDAPQGKYVRMFQMAVTQPMVRSTPHVVDGDWCVSCGQDAVSCQVCGKRFCGSQTHRVRVSDSRMGNVCSVCYAAGPTTGTTADIKEERPMIQCLPPTPMTEPEARKAEFGNSFGPGPEPSEPVKGNYASWPRARLMREIAKAFPKLWTKRGEEFSSQYAKAIWTTAEEGEDGNGNLIFNYYALDVDPTETVYACKVHKKMVKLLNRAGWHAEFHDPGTVFLFRD